MSNATTVGKHSSHTMTAEGDRPFEIGNFSTIAGSCHIHGADNHPSIGDRSLVSSFPFKERWNPIDYPESGLTKGIVKIGSDVWIGENVAILSGVTIGDGAIIGAHSVVAKNIPPYAVAVGNPVVIKRFRFDEETIKKLLNIAWWNWDDNMIRDRIEDLKDIKKFIEKYG